jgi:sucrose phosphorylase
LIVVGAYPLSFVVSDSARSPLAQLAQMVDQVLPENVAIHLLPFGPSSGDWGFAPDDWFSVRPDLGEWRDVEQLARLRKLVVDGVYNHVGLGHPWAKRFFSEPSLDHPVHAYQDAGDLPCARSPRGGPVLRRYDIAGQVWQIWQTFSDSAVDLRLQSPAVLDDVERHLDLLVSKGIWGLRIDAPAYFAKYVGEIHRHHPQAYVLSRSVVAMVLDRGLAGMAQLDCDENGIEYFPYSMGYDIPIVDYAYSAHLALAILIDDPTTFAQHVRDTWNLPCAVIRPPRTHDGVLMRSKLFDPRSKARLVSESAALGVEVRVIDDDPYEINTSLPFMYGRSVAHEQMLARLELALAVTAFVPGWPYYYLPALLEYAPEGHYKGDTDPRSVNRRPISREHIAAHIASGRSTRLRSILELLGRIEESFVGSERLEPQSVEVLVPSTLVIRRNSGEVGIVANFSKAAPTDVRHVLNGKTVIWDGGLSGGRLDPLGYCVWK